ncbi:MAG: nicotinate phosphoribosyltransferase [Bacteroidales bacterium]|nr:nicotinate phosphoribosyltransferase [Bacteroidales bacterium]
MEPIIKHFTDDDLYKFSMCCAILNCFPRAMVRYQFVDRNNTVYPQGFDALLREQIGYLEDLRFTDEEQAFMERRCIYIPRWFYTYLKGFRYKAEWVKVSQDAEGHLSVTFEGYWHETVLLEVKVLSIISELYHIVNGDIDKVDYEAYRQLSYDKAVRMLEAGLKVADFGCRRRLSHDAEDAMMRGFLEASQKVKGPGVFTGSSTVWFAMKYDVQPIGTMAHEFVSSIAGMYGPQEANHIAMDMWQKTFIGSLGIFLYDTFGFKAFADNFSEHFARVFAGLRVDSGDNLEQLDKICAKYAEFGIDSASKQVVFSNALDTDRAIALHKAVDGRVQDSYGIGTHLTCDFGHLGIQPMNIVIKLVASKITEKRDWNDTCKMSEDAGKYTGKKETFELFKTLLHI